MNTGLLSWCKILSLVLLCRLCVVACDHSGSALHRSYTHSNSTEIDVEYDTQRGKKYTKKVKTPPDKTSRSSDDGPQDPSPLLFVLDISNMNETEYTTYKYKDDHHVFIAKEPFLVMAIRRGFTFLWEPTTNRYPNVVVIYPKENETRRLRLFYPGENSGFADPEDQLNQEKTKQLPGLAEPKNQKKQYRVQTVCVDGPKTGLKTRKVARHEDDGEYESDPEPATDIEIQLTEEPKPQGVFQMQPQLQQLSQPIPLVQTGQVSHIPVIPPPEPLSPLPPQPQFQAPVVSVPYLQVQPQLSVFTPQPVPNIFVNLNINDRRSTNILHYYWDHNDNAEVFSLEYPYLFDLVVRGNELIWDPDGNYPYEVRVLHLGNGGISLRVFYPVDEPKFTPQAPPLPQPQPQQPGRQTLKQVPQVSPDQLPVVPKLQEVPQVPQEIPEHPQPMPEEYKPVAQQTQQVAQPAPQPAATPEKSIKKPGNLVRLDINDKWTDEYVEYIWDDRMKADVFVARPPYLIGSVVNGNEILWRRRDGDYPYAISIANGFNGKPVMRVYFPDSQPIFFQSPKKNPGNLVKLDINDKWNDEYVEYIWDHAMNADVFVARPPYVLGTIVDGGEILWRKRDGDYPYAVAIFNPGTEYCRIRIYFSGPKYQPQAQQGPEKPKSTANDQIDNNIQVLDQRAQV